jgi:hypothetical protein
MTGQTYDEFRAQLMARHTSPLTNALFTTAADVRTAKPKEASDDR